MWKKRTPMHIQRQTNDQRATTMTMHTKRETCSINYTKNLWKHFTFHKKKTPNKFCAMDTIQWISRERTCISHFSIFTHFVCVYSCVLRSHFIGSSCVGFCPIQTKKKTHTHSLNKMSNVEAHAHNYVDFVVILNNIISTWNKSKEKYIHTFT